MDAKFAYISISGVSSGKQPTHSMLEKVAVALYHV